VDFFDIHDYSNEFTWANRLEKAAKNGRIPRKALIKDTCNIGHDIGSPTALNAFIEAAR
jgi:hypothetical protein